MEIRKHDRAIKVVEEGFLTIGGVRLEHRRVAPQPGSDDVPVLVLLHEGLGCVGLWKDFPERLAAATGCGVFLWSRAGYGRSDPVRLPRPLDYLKREVPLVPDVLAAGNIDRAILIGHSDGGTIALLHAASSRADGILGVVTMADGWRFGPDPSGPVLWLHLHFRKNLPSVEPHPGAAAHRLVVAEAASGAPAGGRSRPAAVQKKRLRGALTAAAAEHPVDASNAGSWTRPICASRRGKFFERGRPHALSVIRSPSDCRHLITQETPL